jgi:hypothetical protein
MKKRLFLINLIVVLALVLTACNLPTQGEEVGIETAVAQTVAAISTETKVPEVFPTILPSNTVEAATNTPMPTATLAPTSTTAPTLVPTVTTVPSLTPVPIPCNRAEFVSDVTVPDNTSFLPNTAFVKTWRLKNSGTCTWGSGYSLVFHSGNSMGGAASVTLPATIAPGQTVDVSVSLKSPADTGTYTGYWMLKSDGGSIFGLGNNADKAFWVVIKVGDPATATAVAIKTQTSGTCQIVSSAPTAGTAYNSKEPFDTRWKVKNISGKTWSSDSVDVRYKSGTKWFENGVTTYDLPADVADGGTYELILDSIAPTDKGSYSMTWEIAGGGSVLCIMTASITVK